MPVKLTLAQALAAKPANQIAAELVAGLVTEGVDVAGLGDLSVARALIELQARAQAVEEALRVQVAKGGLLRLAPEAGDEWLDLLIENVFDEQRIAATRTQGMLRLSCVQTGGPYTVSRGAFVAQADSGVLYANINDDAPNLAPGSFVEVPFEAQTSGRIGNALGGTITKLVVAQPGVTASHWTVTRTARDKETNEAYILRALGKWGTLGAGGNRAAYDYRIPAACPDVTRWYVQDDNPGGPGTIWVFLANVAGPATAQEIAEVDAYLQPRKGVGSGELLVFPAPAVNVPVVATLVTDGTNPNATAQGAAALQTLAEDFPLGGRLAGGLVIPLYKDKLIQTLMGVAGVVDLIDFNSPIGDTPLNAGEVLTITSTLSQT